MANNKKANNNKNSVILMYAVLGAVMFMVLMAGAFYFLPMLFK